MLWAEEKFSSRIYVLSLTKDSLTIFRVSFNVVEGKSASCFVLSISKACAGHDSSLLTVSKSRLTIGQDLMLQSVAIENPFGWLIIQFLPIVSEDVHKEKNEILNIREY